MGLFYKSILSRGVGTTRAGSGGTLASGVRTIPIASANTWFSAGEPVFVMDAAGLNISWCGKVLTVNASQITVQYPTTTNYTTHNVVKPAKWVLFTGGYASQAADIDTGVVNYESNASNIYRTQTRGQKEIMTISWEDLDTATWLAWRLFLQDAAGLNWGINDVMLAFWNPQFDTVNVDRVRILNEKFPYKTEVTNMKRLSLDFIAISVTYI